MNRFESGAPAPHVAITLISAEFLAPMILGLSDALLRFAGIITKSLRRYSNTPS